MFSRLFKNSPKYPSTNKAKNVFGVDIISDMMLLLIDNVF